RNENEGSLPIQSFIVARSAVRCRSDRVSAAVSPANNATFPIGSIVVQRVAKSLLILIKRGDTRMELKGFSDIEHVAIGNGDFGQSDIEGKAAMGSGEGGGKRTSFNRAGRRQRS